MNQRAQIRLLPDGRRLHLHDGPIDLIVEAFGVAQEVELAYRAAGARFVTVLDELCGELSCLRRACSPEEVWPRGAVARRMVAAVMPYATQCFITPMAAVAGAVAEEILAAMVAAAKLSRAYVNDGGDIALHLMADEKFAVGMVERPDRPSLLGTTTLTCGGSGARHCDQRVARAQLFSGNRGRGHRARGSCGGGRRGSYDHRQRS